jgi:hypothetical protein
MMKMISEMLTGSTVGMMGLLENGEAGGRHGSTRGARGGIQTGRAHQDNTAPIHR